PRLEPTGKEDSHVLLTVEFNVGCERAQRPDHVLAQTVTWTATDQRQKIPTGCYELFPSDTCSNKDTFNREEMFSMRYRVSHCAPALLVVTIASCTGSGKIAEAENPGQSEAIRKYMKENFGYPGAETSWCGSITSVSVRG